jgi:hypothetical protein
LISAMDALYEREEVHLLAPEEEGKDDASVASSQTGRSQFGFPSSRSSVKGFPLSSRAGGLGSSRGGAGMTSRQKLGASASQKGMRGSTKGASRSGRSSARSRSLLEEGVQGLFVGLNAKHCEQAIRTSFMLAMLESDEIGRLERLLEGTYFVTRSLELWVDGLKDLEKFNQYAKLSQRERDETFYADYSVTTDIVKFPTEPLVLLSWTPTPQFLELTTLGFQQTPLRVPSPTSYCLLPLTVHFISWAVMELHRLGRQKHALLLLGWLRAILYVIPLEQKEYVLASAHFKALVILYSCGINETEILQILPRTLGATTVTPAAFVASIGMSYTMLRCECTYS